MTIKKRLSLSFIFAILFSVIIGLIGIYSAYNLADDFDSLDNFTSPATQALERAKSAVIEVESQALIIATHGEADNSKLNEAIGELEVSIGEYRKHLTPGRIEEVDLYEEIITFLNPLKQAALELASLHEGENPQELILIRLNAFKDIEASFMKSIDKALSLENEEFQEKYVKADSISEFLLILGIIGTVLSILLLSFVGFRIYKDLVNPLLMLKEAAKSIAIGNLDRKIEINSVGELNELALSFNAMTEALKESYENMEMKVEDRTKNLEDLRMRNEILIQSIGDGVAVIDREWNITLWNKAAEKLTGWTREEVMGKPFRNYVRFIRERDRMENISFIQDALLFGKVKFMSNHTLLIRKDNEEIPIGDSASPIFDSKNNIIGAIIVFRNLSEELNSQSLKTDFRYASHQMRTPVTKILWNLEAAIASVSEEERKNYIRNAYYSAGSISKMADELLAVAEIDQNMVITRHEMSSLSEILADIFSKVSYIAKPRDIKINYSSILPINLETDRRILTAALLEIIDNSIRYNKDGGTVDIRSDIRDDEVLIEIKDSGVGITEEQQPVVFTKFFRGTNYDTGKIVGAGLGLFIAHAYIRILNGKLWFRSEADKGTTFFILLPKVRHSINL